MAVITLAEYKTLTGISSSAYDTQIEALIPVIEGDIIIFCRYDYSSSWPVGMKIYASKMITYLRQTLASGVGMQSESQGGYSYTKDTEIGSSGYPTDIEKGLAKWRKVGVIYPQIITKWNETRGMYISKCV